MSGERSDESRVDPVRGDDIWKEEMRSGERKEYLVRGEEIWSEDRRSGDKIGEFSGERRGNLMRR